MTREYKPTWADRHGADAGVRLRSYILGIVVFGIVLGSGSFAGAPVRSFVLVSAAAVAGAAASGLGLLVSEGVGAAYSQLMVSGGSTPYQEQHSYQEALVMQGRTDDALRSFEELIAANPSRIDIRTKAAELYARNGTNVARAVELFREIRQIPTRTAGDDVYATNRLVDLFTGPLNDRGRALVELRRLIETYPGTSAAEHARLAIGALKPSYVQPISEHYNVNTGGG